VSPVHAVIVNLDTDILICVEQEDKHSVH